MKTLLTALLILTATLSYGATNAFITLAWEMPTNNVDGTPLTDLAGAKIYYGTASSNYAHIVDVGLTNRCMLKGLEVGTLYYCNGTAYNIAGLESDFCTEVAKRISQPMWIINFRVEASGTITIEQQ